MNAGSELAALRRQITGQCKECNSLFIGLATKKYCSNACRQVAKRKRNLDYRTGKRYPAKTVKLIDDGDGMQRWREVYYSRGLLLHERVAIIAKYLNNDLCGELQKFIKFMLENRDDNLKLGLWLDVLEREALRMEKEIQLRRELKVK